MASSRALCAALGALAGVLVLPTAAGATSVTLRSGTIVVEGEATDNSVVLEPADGGQVRIFDPLATTFTIGEGCVQDDLTLGALCPAVAALEATLGGGRDELALRVGTFATVRVDGGGDDDAISTDLIDPEVVTTAITFVGGDGADSAVGLAGADALDGGPGRDLLDGRSGSDILTGGDGDDVLRGGAGDDRITADTGTDEVRGEAGTDTLDGGPGDDYVGGGDGDDTVVGGEGDDRLEESPTLLASEPAQGGGADAVRGGPGRDEVGYERHAGGVMVSLAGGADDGSAGEGDDVGEVEVVNGSAGPDVITGDALPNTIMGLTGDDVLDGGPGDDVVDGGGGTDLVRGGAGRDAVSGAADADVVDGGPGADVIQGDPNEFESGVLPGCHITGACSGGRDRILARDGAVDRISCGFEKDVAEVDARDKVVQIVPLNRCETVRVGAPPAKIAVSLVSAPRTGIALATSGVRARVSCTAACTVTGTLTADGAVASALGLRSGATVASATGRLRSRGAITVTLKVPQRLRAKVRALEVATLTVTVARAQGRARAAGAASVRLG